MSRIGVRARLASAWEFILYILFILQILSKCIVRFACAWPSARTSRTPRQGKMRSAANSPSGELRDCVALRRQVRGKVHVTNR